MIQFYDEEGTAYSKTKLLKVVTEEWMLNTVTEDWMKRVLLPFVTKTSKVSIRCLEWLCTNYSKERSVFYHWEDPEKRQSRIICIHTEYRKYLKAKSKKNFDPFRRGEKIYFFVDNIKYATTVGQIVFYLWADRYDVLKFLEENVVEVENHMAARQEAGKKRRKITKVRGSLSDEPKNTCMVFSSRCRFTFGDSDGEAEDDGDE